MLYNFDILFKKTLKNGGLKVVTYKQLLKNPEAFGAGEGFGDAEGELSMVLEGTEAGYSINSLLRKYGAQLVGHLNSEMFGKDFPIRFLFTNPNDLTALRIEMRNGDGYTYASFVHTETISGEKDLDLSKVDSFLAFIAKDGKSVISDLSGNITNIATGEVVICSASEKTIQIKSNHSILIFATSK